MSIFILDEYILPVCNGAYSKGMLTFIRKYYLDIYNSFSNSSLNNTKFASYNY